MSKTTRLSLAALGRLPEIVRRPAYDPAAQGIGIVHLGIGAFHRAHQAVYTDDILARGEKDWRIQGVSLRSATVRDQLEPQDGLYTLAVRDNTQEELRVIGSVARVLVAPENSEAVLAALYRQETKVISLTVTEKGYHSDLASGALFMDAPEIAYDLANSQTPKTAIGFIAAALDHCRRQGQTPPTVLTCDNLPHNGRFLKGLIRQFTEARDPSLTAWIGENVSFPSTMVDRIVPATTQGDIAALEDRTGLLDKGMVKSEPFSQWVIEDDFCNARPSWDKAGAQFVGDVAPFEKAKLRLLNGPHSAIAYLGFLAGYDFVHEVMAEPILAAYVERLMAKEIAPTLTPPPGMDLGTHQKALRDRFANSALGHRTYQIAMDGSRKLPQRLLDTIRDRLKSGAPFDGLVIAIAAWMRYVTGADEQGKPIAVQDPLANRFAALAKGAQGDARALAEKLLGLTEIFGKDLPRHEIFRERLIHWLAFGLEQGTMASLKAYLDGPKTR